MMNKRMGAGGALKKRRKMVTTATTFGQTATRNDWTTGISKLQHTYVWLTAGGFFFMTFHLFSFYSLMN